MIVGERIKEARLTKNMSQQELGDKMGVTKVSISGYEKGTRIPTLKNFLDMIEILDLDVKYALGREVMAICEEEANYHVNIASVDLKILNELKKHPNLYNEPCENPKRTVEKISKKI